MTDRAANVNTRYLRYYTGSTPTEILTPELASRRLDEFEAHQRHREIGVCHACGQSRERVCSLCRAKIAP